MIFAMSHCPKPKDAETYYDKNGVPIMEGDLVRSFHFRDRTARGKIRYLYHGVIHNRTENCLEFVPVAELCNRKKDGGRAWVKTLSKSVEVIDGLIYPDERLKEQQR